MCKFTCALESVWRSEDSLGELFSSCVHVGLEDGTRVVRLGGKHSELLRYQG